MNKKWQPLATACFCLLIWFAACSNISKNKVTVDTTAIDHAEGLSTAEISAIEQALANDFRAPSGIVILHNGRLIYEQYRHNQNANDLVEIYSVTKSITSILTGIALYNGDLDSVETPVATLLPTYMAQADERLQNMTIADLLTMSSGLQPNETYESSPITAYRGDLFAEAVALGYRHDPGTVWDYNTLAASLMTGILEAATGQELEAYAAEMLFAPLGITQWEWHRDPNGRVTSAAGLKLRTRDMATIGQLMANNGVWDGKRLLSSDYITTATSPLYTLEDIEDTAGYGYMWWVRDTIQQPNFVANGYASQYVYVVPSAKLVVAISTPCCSGEWHEYTLIEQLILPAVTKENLEAPP